MIPSASLQYDRRRINDEIESAYLATAQAVSNIRMAIATGKGNILAKYSDFYQWYSHLVLLTCDLQEMKDETDLTTEVNQWLMQENVMSMPLTQITDYCKEGIAGFIKYKAALMKRGVITLPASRK